MIDNNIDNNSPLLENLDFNNLPNVDELEAVLGNSGVIPELHVEGVRPIKFAWPNQRVKLKLIKAMFQDWADSLVLLKDSLPEELYQDMYQQFTQAVRNSSMKDTISIIDWMTSGKERPILAYLTICAQEIDPSVTEEEVADAVRLGGKKAADFVALHLARFLHVFLGKKGKEVLSKYWKAYLESR